MKQANVVIIGGGFGGLEAAFYLRWRAQDQVNITLISDKPYFLFKPNSIYIPFGLAPRKLMIGIERPARKKGIRFVQARVQEIDPQKQYVVAGEEQISYDYLIIATGAGMRPDEVPGLSEFGNSIWTPADMIRLRRSYGQLVQQAQAGQTNKVLFLVPPNNKCSGPLYEMVFMLDTWLRKMNARSNVEITYSTYEKTFIQAFGPRLHDVVTQEFARREVTGLTEHAVKEVTKGRVTYQNGESRDYDLLVSFPPYIASTPFPNLPSDERGFLATDLPTRLVRGYDTIYAVGDTGDFPVKQAFLAFLQGDAAAEHLAARILGETPKLAFEPISMCVMEEFDKATFAQVPLHLTGDATRPIEVNTTALDLYKVGVSPVWRIGKKLLGVYLPYRFRAGEPFHAGIPWKGMDLGLKMMSAVLAK